ncbi:WD40 repeat-like protein [Hypoxylon sp. FL0890]|nr:WD40 repeat-like protein [Hypoxylon sp. FL0890]
MAVDASGTSSGRGEVIDLTAVDEDEDEAVASAVFESQPPPTDLGRSSILTNGFGSQTKHNSLHAAGAHDSLIRNHSQPILPSRRLSQDVQSPQPLPSRQSMPLPDHPSKRRKIQHGVGYKTAPSMTDTKALTKCLQSQVFPHLERAVKNLDKDVYDVEKLGGKIIGEIADKDFEHHFHNGNGRLTPDIEAFIIVRIHELVAEYTKGDEFRRHPTTLEPAPQPVPKPAVKPRALVLPSIEGPSNGLVPNGSHEYDGEDPEEYIDGDLNESKEVSLHKVKTPSPRIQPKKKQPITPQQLMTRAKASQWQSGRNYEFKKQGSPIQVRSRWFGLSSRPYLPAQERRQIAAGVGKGRLLRLGPDELRQPSVYHVDFSNEEVKYLRTLARTFYGRIPAKTRRSDQQDLRHVLRKSSDVRASILKSHHQRYDNFQDPPSSLLKRSIDDVQNFLDDLHYRQVDEEQKTLYIERDDSNTRGDASRTEVVPSVLLAREIVGNRLGATRRYNNFTTTLKSSREDYLEPKVEWTNCAGDIMTISWARNSDDFVCGTTTHSDSHNQQYNKPGNLLFGSVKTGKLCAYWSHRIPRPLVEHGDNALASMRESQDPWLYTSVVSSDYDPVQDILFTSSFDHTVKAWLLTHGTHDDLFETWHHDGRVNFVVTNKGEVASKVATAADVPTKAVRVYYPTLNEHVLDYTYHEFSCKRVHGEDYVPSDKWAYFPSAIRWGIERSVNHLLLIGYSPRSLNNDDNEIPEDKRKTGELCLWDTNTKTEIKVNSAATANVFEVAWHPSRATFAAATSASQTSEKIEEHIRTQIRIFELNETTGQYGVVKTLDCPAIDINELAIRPNSLIYSYVAAGCTDGKVYIWDSARSDEDDPMCVLEHGDPVDEIIGDREHEDVGVKFIAWATSTDRLYTGSSDGVVKVWNIRQGKGVLVRDLMEATAPITAGAFSPDFTKLLIGDASGRVYLLDINDDHDDAAASSGFLTLQLNGEKRTIRRPRPFIPHDPPPPPSFTEAYGDEMAADYQPPAQLGQEMAKVYIQSSQLTVHPDPTIGVVQGPAYAETKLYRAEAHLDGNIEAPLLSNFENHQRANQIFSRTTRVRTQGDVGEISQAAQDLHKRNKELSFNIAALDAKTRTSLRAERAEIKFSPLDLDYEDD